MLQGFFFGNKCSQPLSEYSLILPSALKDIFTRYRNLWIFFFQVVVFAFTFQQFNYFIVSLFLTDPEEEVDVISVHLCFWFLSRLSLFFLAFQKLDYDMFKCYDLFIMLIFIKFLGALCFCFYFFNSRKILPLFHGMLFSSFSLSSPLAVFICMNISGHR